MEAIQRNKLRIGNIYVSKYAIMKVVSITNDNITTCKEWIVDTAPAKMKNAQQYVSYPIKKYMSKEAVLKIEANEIETAKVLMMLREQNDK